MSNEYTAHPLSKWVRCPKCGSTAAEAELYPVENEVYVYCPDCGLEHTEAIV